MLVRKLNRRKYSPVRGHNARFEKRFILEETLCFETTRRGIQRRGEIFSGRRSEPFANAVESVEYTLLLFLSLFLKPDCRTDRRNFAHRKPADASHRLRDDAAK